MRPKTANKAIRVLLAAAAVLAFARLAWVAGELSVAIGGTP